MRDWLEDFREELDDMNFKVIDLICSVVVSLSIFMSLGVMKMCFNKFNISTMGSVICGFIFFMIILTVVLFIEEKVHKDDVYEDEEDEDGYVLVDEDEDYYYYESVDEYTDNEESEL